MDSEAKAKVLVVDDEDALRMGVRRLLELEDFIVKEAENGTKGIELGTTEDFDIAIIDLKMPDIGGIEVLKAIREKKPHTICFMATAFASYETAIQAIKLGADGYILKPFTADEFLLQINNGWEKRKLIIEAEKFKKEREDKLLELAFERSRLNTVINALADGVLVVNRDGQVVYYNSAALKFLQLNEIYIEEKITEKLHPKITELINKYLTAEKYEKKSYSTQVEILPNGELFVEVTCSPIPHPDGSLAGVVIVVKNITEFKRVEALKNQFVSMVAHELKAPMAATVGFINILTNKDVQITPEQQQDFLRRSRERLLALASMVNDLLDISRIEMKTVVREIKDINLIDIIKDILDMFKVDIEKRKLTVEFNYSENLPPVPADANEMQRLFTNFISNAIKYNKDQGQIKIDVTSSANYVVVSIQDTGIGMKPNEKAKLFTEFFRAKNEHTKNISGTGLGLSIVKRIVDSYNGKIEVESEYGVGTKFRIYLPYEKK